MDQSHALLDVYVPIRDPCHPGRELSSVLQGAETEIYVLEHRGAVNAVSTENAAHF